jgi:hypothetical protein
MSLGTSMDRTGQAVSADGWRVDVRNPLVTSELLRALCVKPVLKLRGRTGERLWTAS